MPSDKDIAISIKGVSKCFEMYDKPFHRLLQMFSSGRKTFAKEFRAVQDINIEVRRGECVGIIGRNGAGKSTLLQMIAGTLQPTSGTIEVRGRVAALLELGSGFNPNFTGRENVFMNAAILGLSPEEINDKYEDIVEFADIGEFINQPVKTYSSGMMVRLAFAVQVMVKPDVLIVDEALAVGDIGFQMKCFQKLKELVRGGTTLLFVTHDLSMVSTFCQKVLFMQDGRQLIFSSDVPNTINAYKESMRKTHQPDRDIVTEASKDVSEYRFGSHDATIEKYEILDSEAGTADSPVIRTGRVYRLKITINSKKDFPLCILGTSLRNREGLDIWGDNTLRDYPDGFPLHKGENVLVFETPFNINAGEYGLTVGLADISTTPRLELDQRWPIRHITVVAEKPQPSFIYAPMRRIQ